MMQEASLSASFFFTVTLIKTLLKVFSNALQTLLKALQTSSNIPSKHLQTPSKNSQNGYENGYKKNKVLNFSTFCSG